MRLGSNGDATGMAFFTWLKAGRKPVEQPKGLLGRLRRDQRGATLAMMAASIIPMVGIIGGAVDMSRAYLVKTRLQQACDAGALAARRMMTGSALDSNAKTHGQNFYKINLANGAYGATVNPVVLTDKLENGKTVGIVKGDATARVPTTLMRIFGKQHIDMTATCEAQLNVTNNDIMFVLDVTGSMSCLPADNVTTCDTYAGSNIVLSGGRYQTTEKTNSRIDGLRDAVKNFFSTVRNATTSTARLRVGFVPYSSGVNVGELLRTGASSTLATGSITYQSRKARFTTPVYVGTTGSPTTTIETYSSTLSSANCTKYQTNKSYPTLDGASFSSGTAPANVTQTTYSAKDWGATGTTTGTNRTCRRNKTVTVTTYVTRYGFTDWLYQPESYNVTSFATGSTVTLADPTTSGATVTAQGNWNAQELVTLAGAQGFATSTQTWDRCIEEPNNNAVLDNAPNTAATRWRPTWPGVVYSRAAGASSTVVTTSQAGTSPWYPASGASYIVNYSCPKAATRLATMTQAQVDAYVDGADFFAHGRTYHDIGMIWGARLMSTTGIFSADHGAAPNGKAVNRHVIFMTDGDMKPNIEDYAVYGIEKLEKRISLTGTPTDASLKTLHNTRFLAACQAAKNNGISVWVVAFGPEGVTSELSQCANSGQAFAATSSAQLNSQFQVIAQRIAELRLSK